MRAGHLGIVSDFYDDVVEDKYCTAMSSIEERDKIHVKVGTTFIVVEVSTFSGFPSTWCKCVFSDGQVGWLPEVWCECVE